MQTEENKTAAELRRELAELKRRLWEMEAAFYHSCNGISIVDSTGKIIRSNEAMRQLYELSEEQFAGEFVGKSVQELVTGNIFNDEVSTKVIATGRPVSIIQEVLKKKRCLTQGAPVFGPDGRVELVIVNSHDVTELYALQENLKEKLRQSQKLADRYQAELSEIRITLMKDEEVIVRSKKMLDVLDLTRRLAPVDTTVLILGESGAGKEVIADLLHKANPRRSQKAFIKVNCGAIPRDLLESELFGYEPGAFTGASREGRRGLFELADGGSIFLDEVGELPLDLQVKLLRVLQEKEFTRLGSTKVTKVDVRVIAASNKDLEEMVKAGRFRQDLYYRLSVVPLRVPPLRDRKEDIVAIAQHYVTYFNRKYGLNKVLSAELLDVMEGYAWPGNVRELINVVERMVVTSRGDILGVEEFPVESKKNQSMSHLHRSLNYQGLTLKEALEITEKEVIAEALAAGRTAAAAKKLGISRATLARKMRKYGIRIR
ncbi:MAG: sigma 54-interacting transcriptional regulator [Armatimonadetes bacterium]|nr:sigma 54-interacting transcriptional regulator [Armatimonadota bacterium]